MRSKRLLNGVWDYRIGKGDFQKKYIPYSEIPVGESECVLNFDLSEYPENKRIFLVFEGITYSAKVYLNDEFLGEMYPYSEYRFEITDIIKGPNNTLDVKIYDCNVVFGPSEGWENYSGIIRDVYIEYTNETYIEDFIWHDELCEDFTKADGFVEFFVNNPKGKTTVKAVLTNRRGVIVAEKESEDNTVQFTIDKPELWSPDSPYLYSLECSVYCDGVLCDRVLQRVGFKKLETRGRRFYLNGEPFFILGVNRHDMYGDHGHTLTEEEMVKDMRMIKDTGVNYVRLVHYPHNKRIIELADELGLLVSEEPGLWWADMNNEELCSGALEVLKKAIIRDRNHISIAFWLSFNECIFTLDYLKASAKMCREYDKYHMVSGANCMSLEMTKENYPKCGFDFYTMHPYDTTPQRLLDSAEALSEMPLLLTEWGGCPCYNNPNLFTQFIETIIQCWNNPDDKPVLAGAVYWCWAEMYEFSRPKPACSDGILREGLVDIYRNPNPDLEIYKRNFAKLKYPETKKNYDIYYDYKVDEKENYKVIDIDNLIYDKNKAWDKMITDSKVPVKPFYYENKKNRRMTNGPVIPCEVLEIGKLPVKLSAKPYVVLDEIEIPVNLSVSKLYIAGNTSMPKGFPIGGEYGEDVCEYVVEYSDGTNEVHIMKNGYDITTATAQHGPSRINPVAVNSPRILKFNYDIAFEHYIVNLREIDADSTKTVKSLKIKDLNNGYNLLFYGLTVLEKEEN